MTIVDPIPFFGIDSGMRTMRVTKAEAATLLRAAAILERGHRLLTAYNPDHQGDYEGANEALCLGPQALRDLATDGFDL